MHFVPSTHSPDPRSSRDFQAFTLMELLVVIAIIGLIAGMALPSLSNFAKSNRLEAGLAQLQGDLSIARIRAMNERTDVHMVFMPNLTTWSNLNTISLADINFLANDLQANNAMGFQCIGYALYADRSIGDQPGQSTPRYISEWKALPEGVYFHPSDFYNTNNFRRNRNFPFPRVGSGFSYRLPYLTFNSKGQLETGLDCRIPLIEGSATMGPPTTNGLNQVWDVDLLPKTSPLVVSNVNDGVLYLVSGNGSVSYRATTYNFRQAFEGNGGFNTFSILSGTPDVIQFEGVSVNWLTGRSRAVQPQF